MNERAGKRPVSSHRLFVPAIGLWFAVLIGAGLFVMPAAVQDAIATRTGLAAALPLAAPPVGLAGRLVISGLGALLGLLIGLVIAQRIARANKREMTGEDRDTPGFGGFEDDIDPQDRVWLDGTHDDAPVTPPEVLPALADEQPQRRRRLFNPREEMSGEGIGYEASPLPPLAAEPEEERAEETAATDAVVVEPWDALDPDPVPTAAVHDSNIQVNIGFRKPIPHAVTVSPPTWDMADPPLRSAAAAPAPEPEQAPADATPLAELPLSELVARLGRAVEMRILTGDAAGPISDAVDDHVISFPAKDSGRRAGTDEAVPAAGDPQDVLRQALDKLSRVSNPK